MAAAYFFGELGLQEAEDFVEGARKRVYDGYNQARMLCDVVCGVLSGKDAGIVFPWEEPTEDEQAEKLEAAKETAKKLEQLVAEGKIKIGN